MPDASILSDGLLTKKLAKILKPNHPLPFAKLVFTMPINLVDLEAAIRNAVPVAHLEVEDQSSGCGENYAIILVSEVGHESFRVSLFQAMLKRVQAFEGKNTLARHRFGEQIQSHMSICAVFTCQTANSSVLV
jgi:stress-induced morphogen